MPVIAGLAGLVLLAALAGESLLALPVASGQSSVAPADAGTPRTGDRQTERPASRRVLLLYSEGRLTRSVVSIDTAFRAALEARSPGGFHFYTEFLDLNSFHGAEIERDLGELLRRKYQGRPFDLVVSQGQLNVPFVLKNRAELFANAPVVFVAVESSTFAGLSDTNVTGTWRRRGWSETLELARRFHPGIRRAVVVVGSTKGERLWLDAARQQLAGASSDVTYLVDRSFDQIVEAVAALPSDAVVLVGPFLRDGTGRDFHSPTLVNRLVAVARVPIYGVVEGSMGEGVIGGHVVSFDAHGRVAADLAHRLLSGERPAPTDAGTTASMFDERQLRRWGIDQRRLPAGSVVLFHEPSMWELYREYIVGAVVLLLAQSALIGVLLVQRARRRRAENTLAERLRFETLLSELSAALSSCPVSAIDRQIEAGLHRLIEDLGSDRATVWLLDSAMGGASLAQTWARAGVPPVPDYIRASDFPWIFRRLQHADVLRIPPPDESRDETATDCQSLARIHALSAAVAPLVEGGTVVGALSVCSVVAARPWADEVLPRLRLLADIFANALARQRAERAAQESATNIRDLAGRLMTAEEQERRRIARELHDGLGQDIAAMSIALSALQRSLPPDTPDSRHDTVRQLQERAVELAETVRHLSHELHPGTLEYAGLAAAVRSHCREVAHDGGLTITCRAADDLGDLPADVALCLYRVAQEALKNAVRHAKASHATVDVSRDRHDVVLTIRDDGRGFDLEAARRQGGLGLISLDERARLVGGRISIDTGFLRGTEVRVVVPLDRLGA